MTTLRVFRPAAAVALALLAAPSLTGCFYLADRGRALEARVDKLDDERGALEAKLEATRATLAATEAALKSALDQLDKSARTTGANIGVKVDAAIQEVAELRGALESSQHRLGELEKRLAQLEAARAGSAGVGGEAAAPGAPKGTQPEAAERPKDTVKWPDDPKELLRLADEKRRGGELELARRLYAELLRRWPREPQAGEAHAGLGQAWFADGKCPEALYDFGKVITEHKKTRSAPVVYLQSAECFRQAKMLPEAKQVLQELLQEFPKSDVAKQAQQLLAQLEKRPETKTTPKPDKKPDRKAAGR